MGHLLLYIILLVLLIKASLLGATTSGIHFCNDKCGAVEIRYPFGIKEGCYFNEGFKVTCNESSGSAKPFIAGIDLQFLSIYRYTDSALVNVPVLSSDCKKSSGEGVDLSSSPFAFSTLNRFTAIGCDNFAKMNNQNNSIIGGCLSTCTDETKNTTDRCYGLNCCQIPIPPYLKYLNASITSITSQHHECRSAFIIDQAWRTLSKLDALKDEEHVPAVLEWGRTIGSCYETISRSPMPICYGETLDASICWMRLSEKHLCECNDLSRGICQGSLICMNFTVGNNCSICPDGYHRSDQLSSCIQKTFDFNVKKSQVKVIIIGCSAGLGTLFLLIGAFGLYKVIKRRKAIKLKQKFFKRNGGLLLQQQLSYKEGSIEKTMLFTSKELEMATDNYNANRILGQGGQGTVYKGMLSDGRIVAIKRSKIIDDNNLEHFINEVVILTQVNHRNVVKLLGCCLETEVPLLVYEFVPNGTLFEYIHEQIEEFPLTWEIRLRIAIEVADAVSYLHSAASIPIYHRDIKSANILLDDKYRAKVSDFGTSRSITVDQTHLTTQVQGTFGYLDPEFFRSSQFTEKSDVYSFGVVLTELLTGQKPIRSNNLQEDKSLAAYLLHAIKENCLFEILDAQVKKEGEKEEIVRFANLAKRCLNLNGKKRPTMREVAAELLGIRSLNGASVMPQNYEELDYVDGDINGYFETGTSSNGSFLNSGTLSIDVEPLISNK